jgi:hypothetical protein
MDSAFRLLKVNLVDLQLDSAATANEQAGCADQARAQEHEAVRLWGRSCDQVFRDVSVREGRSVVEGYVVKAAGQGEAVSECGAATRSGSGGFSEVAREDDGYIAKRILRDGCHEAGGEEGNCVARCVLRVVHHLASSAEVRGKIVPGIKGETDRVVAEVGVTGKAWLCRRASSIGDGE